MERTNIERQSEQDIGSKTFSVPVPGANLQKKVSEKFVIPKEEKTALYIDEKILREKCKFAESKERPHVFHCHDTTAILNAVLNRSEVGYRYKGDQGGLENDLTKQQIVFYAAVFCKNQVVLYQRSSEKTVERPEQLIGDQRLEGKVSIGFGGHITAEDIKLSKAESLVIHKNLQGVSDVIGRSLGVSRSLYTEITEEIGVHEDQIFRSEILGAFMDRQGEIRQGIIPVSWVHLAVPLILELDPELTDELIFNSNEVGRAWWVPIHELLDKLRGYKSNPQVEVEPWTEIMIEDYLAEKLI